MSILAVVSKQTRMLQWRSLVVDLDQRAISVSGTNVTTSPAEFSLLQLLLSNRNVPFAKGGILQALFGPEHGRDDRQVDVYVARLRRALSLAGLDEVIAIVPGRGYAVLDDIADRDTADLLQPQSDRMLVAA